MRFLLSFTFLVFPCFVLGQSWETAPLPMRLKGLPRAMVVDHFPNPVRAVANPGHVRAAFAWKHNTSVMATEEIVLEECGAFLWTGTEWRLRVAFERKEFARLFGCKRGRLLPGQPYSFVNNWRSGNVLFEGIALWYFIGRRASGEQVMGTAAVTTLSSTI